MNPIYFNLICKFFTLYFGALGTSFLFSIGVIDTSIIFTFTLTAILFGYFATYNVFLGVFFAFVAAMLGIFTLLLTCHFKRNTYILAMYVLSMMSLPLGKLILRLFPWDLNSDTTRTPTLHLFSAETHDLTVCIIAVISGVISYGLFHQYSKTSDRFRYLLWAEVDSYTLKDMQLALILSFKQIFSRISFPVCIVGFLYFLSILFGSFFTLDCFTVGHFDYLPFWMLLIGIASKGRLIFVLPLVTIYIGSEQAMLYLFQDMVVGIPSQTSYIVYGLVFLCSSWLTSDKKAIEDC